MLKNRKTADFSPFHSPFTPPSLPFHSETYMFRVAKHKLLHPERPSFATRKLSFRKVKHIPFGSETWWVISEKWFNALIYSGLVKVAHFCVIWREKNFFSEFSILAPLSKITLSVFSPICLTNVKWRSRDGAWIENNIVQSIRMSQNSPAKNILWIKPWKSCKIQQLFVVLSPWCERLEPTAVISNRLCRS